MQFALTGVAQLISFHFQVVVVLALIYEWNPDLVLAKFSTFYHWTLVDHYNMSVVLVIKFARTFCNPGAYAGLSEFYN